MNQLLTREEIKLDQQDYSEDETLCMIKETSPLDYEKMVLMLESQDFSLIYNNIDEKINKESIHYNKVEDKRANTLKSRWNCFHFKMNDVMNQIFPETYFVALHWDIPIVMKMLFSPEWKIRIPIKEDIIFKLMEGNQCHDNIKELYDNKEISEMCEGYVLSKDGVWRNHSWGIDKDDNVVETTELRLCYLTYK